jgi:hypothetical protein
LCCRVVTFYAPTLKQNKFYSCIRFGRKSHGNTNVFVELLLPAQFKTVLEGEPEYGRSCSVIVRPIACVSGTWADPVTCSRRLPIHVPAYCRLCLSLLRAFLQTSFTARLSEGLPNTLGVKNILPSWRSRTGNKVQCVFLLIYVCTGMFTDISVRMLE